jgi:dCTP deaminase
VILSNREVLAAVADGGIVIDPPLHDDLKKPPFNSTAIDLRLGPKITVPRTAPVALRLDRTYDARYVALNSDEYVINEAQPYCLDRDRFVLARTEESISLPVRPGRPAYAARVEGKSSRARLGMLVHFSAPTVHSGFQGPIALEIINLGPNSIQLVPHAYICQIVFEMVAGTPELTPSQFRGQRTASGEVFVQAMGDG